MQEPTPIHLEDFKPVDPMQQAQLYVDMQRMQQRQQLAQALMGAQYVPNSGASGVLGVALSALAGARMQDRNNKGMAATMRDYFASQNEAAMAKRQQEQADEEKKFNRELQKIGYTEKAKRDFAPRRLEEGFINWDPSTGSATIDPTLQRAMLQQKLAGRSVTSVNLPATVNENAFQKTLGEKDAASFVDWRDKAVAARNVQQQADTIEQILGNAQTGKVPEALAMAGQYFGTQAGANLQALRGAIQPVVLAQVKQLGSGSGISDADRKFIEGGMPGLGNDPRANAQLLKIMRSTSQRSIDQYTKAQDYVNQKGTLAGFVPDMVQTPSASNGGRIVTAPNGKRYRIVGEGDDPEVEEVP